jgi:hypothetical protein
MELKYNIIIDKSNYCFKILEDNKELKHFTGVINKIIYISTNNVLNIIFTDSRKKYSNSNIIYILHLSLNNKVNIYLLNLLITTIYEKESKLQNITILITKILENNKEKISYLIKNTKNIFLKPNMNLNTLIEMMQEVNQINDIIYILNQKIIEKS